MSYEAYVIEETMHAKQAEIARRADGYPTRAAARTGRKPARGRSWPQLFSRVRTTSPVPCARAADVAGAC